MQTTVDKHEYVHQYLIWFFQRFKLIEKPYLDNLDQALINIDAYNELIQICQEGNLDIFYNRIVNNAI